MATDNKLLKYFDNFKGLDLRVSDLAREQGAATVADNVILRETGALSKRKGYHINANPSGGYGIFKFPNVNTTTDVVTNELLTISNNLYKKESDSFTLTYTGSDSAYYDLYYSPDDLVFYFDVYDNNIRVINVNLGTGKELVPATVSTLTTALNALANFTCTSATNGSAPSAFLPLGEDVTIAATGTTITFNVLTAIDTPNGITNPFSSFYAARNGTDFENASFAVVNDVCYIATGYDNLHKYDGNRVYKAGLPQGTTPLDGAGGGGSLTYSAGELYQWKYTYEYTDSKENVVESKPTAVTDYTTTGAGQSRQITVYYLQNTSGFNTDEATINGNQVGVTTIAVTSNTLKVGDYCYINDGVTSSIVKRKVTASSASSITIEGDAVNVTNAETISNIKITLWRTKGDGSLFYLSKEFVNDVGTASVVYDDGTADASLGIQFIEHVTSHDLPPIGKYLDVWRGTLVISGIKNKVNTVFFSDVDSPEYFPDPDNSFIVDTTFGTKITGIRSLDNALYVFKNTSISAVFGDFNKDGFTVDTVSDEYVGCQAAQTIREFKGELWFLGEFGIYSISQQGLKERSFKIAPRFRKGNGYNFKRATGFIEVENDRYVCYVPTTESQSGEIVTTLSASKAFIYDGIWDAWLEWTSLDLSGGMEEIDGEIFFMDRLYSSTHSAVRTYLNKVGNGDIESDYADHNAAISISYKTHWETLGEPAVYKRFRRIKVYGVDVSLNNFESSTGFGLTVTTEHDYDVSSESTITMDFTGGSLGWGNSGWGNFPWGESRLYSIKNKLKSRKTRALRIAFANNTINENVLISGYELDVVAPFRLEIKEN